MLSVRTVMMTVLTVTAFGAGWLAKTNAQQKAPAPLITYFSHEKVEASFAQALATTGSKDLFTRKDRQGRMSGRMCGLLLSDGHGDTLRGLVDRRAPDGNQNAG